MKFQRISGSLPQSYIQRVLLQTPVNSDWEPSIAQQCMVGLFASDQPFSLQIRAQYNFIDWCVEVPASFMATVQNHFYSLYPLVQLTDEPKLNADIDCFHYELQGAAPFVGPLMHATDFSEIDPLIGIVTVMSSLQQDEACILNLTLSPPLKNYARIGMKLVTESRHRWWQFLTPHMAMETITWQSVMGVERRIPKYDADIQKEAERKLRMPLKETDLSFKIQANSQTRADELIMQLSSPLAIYSRDGLNAVVPANPNSYQLILSPPEVAALWHLPNQACSVPGITWVMDKHVPIPVALTQVSEGIALGHSSYHGRHIDVQISDADRITHINLIGRTRTGKSTLLHNMIHQDIQDGKGIGVIDPHGDLVEDILEKSISQNREDDVVLFDWEETEKIIGLNPLQMPSDVDVATAASHTLAIFRKFFGEYWIEGRMEDTVYACLVSLMSTSNAVVLDIPRILLDAEFRHKIISQVTDIAALDYWQLEFEPANYRGKIELARPVNTRIRRFYRDRTLRRIIGQSDCLDFTNILDSRKIFLANLRGATRIEGDSIGALLIAKFQMAAMSRARQARVSRLPFYLYIDEVQNFVVSSLHEMLSEAAKYGLNLVIANQYMGQLDPNTTKAVLGNVGTNIIFRSGRDEAELFSALIEPTFSRDDILNLSRFKAVIKTQHNGTTLPAFLVNTYPQPEAIQNVANPAERIAKKSRQKYGKSVDEIDAELAQRYQSNIERQDPSAQPTQRKNQQSGSDISKDQFYG